MKVQDVMTRGAEACSRNTDLAAAAMIMWRMDCGVVPVVGEDGREAVGMITDRDICVAVATRHRRAEEITVGEVISGTLYKVRPGDDIRAALEAMQSERVRRLPVVRDGALVGIISINDIIRAAEKQAGRVRPDISPEDVLEVMKAICEPDGGLEVGRKKAGEHESARA
jgi:CBS domain-containing protein